MRAWFLKIQATSFIHNEFIGGLKMTLPASGKGWSNRAAVLLARLGGGTAVPPDSLNIYESGF
jgi:hypothetical protein